MTFADYITRTAITLLGLVYPGYQSYKAVKRANVSKQQQWLKYWLVLSVISFLAVAVEPLLCNSVPYWNALKIAFVAYLVSPTLRGYEKIYATLLLPQLEKHEAVIDETASKMYIASSEQAKNFRPAVTNMVQQLKTAAEKTLYKKAS